MLRFKQSLIADQLFDRYQTLVPNFFWRFHKSLQHRCQASGGSEAKRRSRVRALRLPSVRCGADDLEEPRVAQALLQLCRVPPFVRLYESERCPRRGHLLPWLLQPEFRAEGCRLRHGGGYPDDGLTSSGTSKRWKPVLYIYIYININIHINIIISAIYSRINDQNRGKLYCTGLFVYSCV